MPNLVPFSQLRGSGGRFTERNQGIMWTGLDVIANNINRRGKTLNASRKRTMEKMARDMEAYAKANAPWKDRTHDARDRLQGVAVHDDRKEISTAFLGHGVGYGFYLETMQGGRFQIIMPTIQHFGKRVLSTVNEYDTADSVIERMYGE